MAWKMNHVPLGIVQTLLHGIEVFIRKAGERDGLAWKYEERDKAIVEDRIVKSGSQASKAHD